MTVKELKKGSTIEKRVRGAKETLCTETLRTRK